MAYVKSKRRRLSANERREMERQALQRALSSQTMSNWPAIIAGFMEKGIPADDIKPRENVFTYHAWRALGRQVRRGEKGVRCQSWVPIEREDPETGEKVVKGSAPVSAVVFHVSQTDVKE